MPSFFTKYREVSHRLISEDRQAQRQKQIDFGKITVGYWNFRLNFPDPAKAAIILAPPGADALLSKLDWDEALKSWRIELHKWDVKYAHIGAEKDFIWRCYALPEILAARSNIQRLGIKIDLPEIGEYMNKPHSFFESSSSTIDSTEDLIINEQRQKQIDLGKLTVGYWNFRANYPDPAIAASLITLPSTTDGLSKRSWHSVFLQWRRELHKWDDQPVPAGFKNDSNWLSHALPEILAARSNLQRRGITIDLPDTQASTYEVRSQEEDQPQEDFYFDLKPLEKYLEARDKSPAPNSYCVLKK